MKKILIICGIIFIIISTLIASFVFILPWLETKDLSIYETDKFILYYPQGFIASKNNGTLQDDNTVFAKSNNSKEGVIYFKSIPNGVDFAKDYPNLTDADCLNFLTESAKGTDQTNLQSKAINNYSSIGCEDKYQTASGTTFENRTLTNKYNKKIKSYSISIMYGEIITDKDLNQLEKSKVYLYIK